MASSSSESPEISAVILALDTATDDTCVGACRDGEVLFETQVGPADGGRARHAVAALPGLDRAAGAAGGWAAVDRIVVGLGPGSFTGLRIGIATVKGAGSAAGVELVGVSTLDALALPAFDEIDEGLVLTTTDARRGEIFAALYAGHDRVWDPFVASPAEVAERLHERGENVLAVGSGALRFRDDLDVCAEIPDESCALHRVAARHLCTLGARAEASESLEPDYLRPPDAERWHDRNAPRKS